MNVVIIEDERPAAERLHKMLAASGQDIHTIALLHSVQEATAWFQSHAHPDLVFMDIELSDGNSLDLVEKASIRCPIIFTTAFDHYWQEAFELYSIDYLLKPLKQDRLEMALHKYQELKHYFASRFTAMRSSEKPAYKDRFLVKRGREFVSIRVQDIAYFYAAHKLVCLTDRSGSRFILDQSLSDLEKQVDPSLFFRINRKYLVGKDSITRILALPKSRLQLEVLPAPPDEICISAENSAAFKEWMG
ncbi:MAG TPA: LytTR family DNA-binding domain-containing protein [Flavisolibacter sp.]|jgi:two-component system LytT family response regulator|nr:LytTR family DNA-binding domain-containing protein [Flavisolibacter sp.]